MQKKSAAERKEITPCCKNNIQVSQTGANFYIANAHTNSFAKLRMALQWCLSKHTQLWTTNQNAATRNAAFLQRCIPIGCFCSFKKACILCTLRMHSKSSCFRSITHVLKVHIACNANLFNRNFRFLYDFLRTWFMRETCRFFPGKFRSALLTPIDFVSLVQHLAQVPKSVGRKHLSCISAYRKFRDAEKHTLLLKIDANVQLEKQLSFCKLLLLVAHFKCPANCNSVSWPELFYFPVSQPCTIVFCEARKTGKIESSFSIKCSAGLHNYLRSTWKRLNCMRNTWMQSKGKEIKVHLLTCMQHE